MKSIQLVTTEVLSAFGHPHDAEISILEGGHINHTFLVEYSGKEVILQRINSYVFPHPDKIMENICSVTAFLQKKTADRGGDPMRECLTVLPTTDNQSLFIDKDGGHWRCVLFIPGATAHETPSSTEMLMEAGYAFGDFQNLLNDFPADSLHEIIENFHHTPSRFQQLMDAAKKNTADRLKNISAEMEFALARKADCAYLCDRLENGILPLKVTHNDTKMSNVLIDDASNKAICIIDLDTVMPGLVAYDFGDSIRAGATTAAEDETDLSKVNFSLPMYEAYTAGFLKACGSALTPAERESLPYGAKLMTLEVGMRFLADYLNGDVYFRTAYPEHNLDRARNQFKLVADMEKCHEQMLEIVEKYTSVKT